MRHRIWTAILVAYAGGLFTLSHFPSPLMQPLFPHFDKCFHAAEFALFLALAWKATNRRALLSLVLTAAYAGTDEIHQLFVATRTASVLDLAADWLGAAIGLLVLESAHRLWQFRRRRILATTNPKVES